MPQKITAKQEGFCLAVAEGQTLTDAYRASYAAKNMADKTVIEAASRLRANSNVTARLKELRAMAAERTLVTIETLTLELDENRTEARRRGQASAMNAATMGKDKLHGLLVDRVETKDARTVEVATIDVSTLSTSALRELRAARINGTDKANPDFRANVDDADLNAIADERAGGPFVKTGLDDL